MTTTAEQMVLAAFLVFSRIGACLLLVPGFSSPRIPVQVRLFVAVGLSLALTPLLLDVLRPLTDRAAPLDLLKTMSSELMVGAMIGLLARFYFVALETIAMAMAMAVGLSSNLGAPVNEEEPLPALSTLLTLAATLLLFVTDQHLVLFRALAGSYSTMPVQAGFAPQFALIQLVNSASASFMLALRIGSPFLIFSVILNLAVGLANRLVPTVQIYFLASPFLLIGGLLLLTLTVRSFLQVFMTGFSHFLANG